jgi:hypothetical protein
MGRYGDTVWVHEEGFPSDRLVLFNVNGVFLSQRPDLDTRPSTPAGVRFTRTPLTRNEDGISIRHFVDGAMTESNPRVGVARFSASMVAIDTIVAYDMSRLFARRGSVFVPSLANVFADHPLVAAQPGGTHILVADRGAGRDALELRRVNTVTGRNEYVSRFPMEARRLTAAEIDSAIGAAGRIGYQRAGPAAARAGTVDDFIASLKRGTSLPRNAPLASAIVAGMDGTGWVRLWGASNSWIAFDSSGRAIQRVTLPSNAELVVAERDYIWAVTWDSNDVPWITTFRVTR